MKDQYFGYPACIFTIILYLSQIIHYFDISTKSFKLSNIQLNKILFNYVFTFFWYFFGEMLYYDPIKVCNLVGLLTFLFLICLYLFYDFQKEFAHTFINIILVTIFSITFYHYFSYVVIEPKINGQICIGISVISYIYNIYLFIKVIKDSNLLLINISTEIISIIASSLWYQYGYMNKDFYIQFCFGIKAIIHLVQIILYCSKNKKYQKLNSTNINSVLDNTDKIKNETKTINAINDEENEKMRRIFK